MEVRPGFGQQRLAFRQSRRGSLDLCATQTPPLMPPSGPSGLYDEMNQCASQGTASVGSRLSARTSQRNAAESSPAALYSRAATPQIGLTGRKRSHGVCSNAEPFPTRGAVRHIILAEHTKFTESIFFYSSDSRSPRRWRHPRVRHRQAEQWSHSGL